MRLVQYGIQKGWLRGLPDGQQEREREFALFPAYKANYIKAFERMDKSAYTGDGVITPESTGKEVFDWWMQDPRFYGQTELEGWRDGEE